MFGEYQDAEIVRLRLSRVPQAVFADRHGQYEALRRVHLIPAGEASEESESVNANVFRNLDSPVSEAGENFSTG